MAALDFGTIQMTDATFLNKEYFNPIWQELVNRQGKILIPLLVSGTLTTGRKGIIRIPWDIRVVKVSLSAPTYPAGAHIICQLYKNGEPGGGAAGTAMYTSGARPTLLTTDTDGSSDFASADVAATLPLLANDRIAFNVEQADLGPVSNMLAQILLEP